VLLRLWPFEGGFSWSGAEAVQPPSTDAVLAVLASLVDRSVVTADTSGYPARYRMLETIRRYCRDADPDPAASEEAHAAWVRQLASEQSALVLGPHPSQDLRVLIGELANIRAGITHDLEHNPGAALRTTSALSFLWSSAAALPEGMRLTQAALDACPAAAVDDRVEGLLALSVESFHAGEPADAVRLADAAMRFLSEPAGEQGTLLLKALVYRAVGAADLGDANLVRATLDQFAVEARDRPVPDWIRADALLCEGAMQLLSGDRDGGETTLGVARELAGQCGFFYLQGAADLVLARSLVRGRAPEVARAHRAGLALSRALRIFQDQANVMDQLAVLYAGAHTLAVSGSADAAVVLWAAVGEHAGRIGISLSRYARLSGAAAEQRMSTILAAPERAAAESMGRALSWPAMVTLFTDTVGRPSPLRT